MDHQIPFAFSKRDFTFYLFTLIYLVREFLVKVIINSEKGINVGGTPVPYCKDGIKTKGAAFAVPFFVPFLILYSLNGELHQRHRLCYFLSTSKSFLKSSEKARKSDSVENTGAGFSFTVFTSAKSNSITNFIC